MANKRNHEVETKVTQTDTENVSNIEAPPIKPFSKGVKRNLAQPSGHTFRPEIPRRVGEIPGMQGQGDKSDSGILDNDNSLTVGKNISLNGEITSCDRLIVEGTVEVKLSDASIIEITSNGCFKGSAEVQTADINGSFEGTLVVNDVLTIRKDGRVSGSVRYGRIIIESGGQIFGDMASLDTVNDRPKN